jgi:hypothetical protein
MPLPLATQQFVRQIRQMFPTLSRAIIAPTGGEQMQMGMVLSGASMGVEDHNKQPPQNTRRNGLPVKLIDGAFLMRQEHLTGALVELMQIGKTSSGPDGIFHDPPEAFDRIEVVPTMGG